ncbi:MAG: PilZ domain-containing protein [Candidatus Sulfotelmatobacter sp.]
MATTLATPRTQIAKRRSSRIALNTPIGLSGQDSQKCPFTMPAKATNLNRHGAAVEVARDLLVGSTIMVRNPRGTQVSARVISQLAASQGVSVYAIEFVEQDDAANNFWGITFPLIASRAAVAEQSGMARRRRGLSSLQN